MRTKEVGKGIIKGTLWGAATYATFTGGTALRKIGDELMRQAPKVPYLGVFLASLGVCVYVAGDIVRYGAIVPACGVGLNAIDVAAGVVDRQAKNEDENA